ncbi:MAG: CRTAC1 family protein [Terracidiphilus sp.]
MKITRRSFVSAATGALLFPAEWMALAEQQGIASRGVKPQARPPASGRPFDAHFVNVAHEAGLRIPTIYGGIDKKKYILEANGCGCAFIDYDNDGWMDIFLLCGTRLEGAPPEATNRLYKNNRDGTFSDVTDKAGLHAVGWGNGVCIGDYNNDGFEDIFCTYYGENRLYRNNGNGTFTDVTGAAGLLRGETRWGAGCSFVDYNRDGHLDLFISNYIRFDLSKAPQPGAASTCNWKGIPVNCGPRGLPTGRHLLYRNNGDGTFTDVTKESGIASATESYGMTVVAADFDEDGWTDIFVACDSTPSLLFMNNHDGTFREEGVLRGVALSEDGMEQAGMGVGIGDYGLDGHLDLFKTHFMGDTCGIFRNDGTGNFDDRTRAAKIGVETRFVSWGTGLEDFDNDGFPDVLIVTGSVYPEVEKVLADYPYKTPRILFRNLGNGTFEELGAEAGPGIVEAHSGRGCAFGDFDNDGDVDVVIVNMNEPPTLLRNDLSGHRNWIKIFLEGVKSNRSAIGARVLVHYGGKVQARARVSQSSYYSSCDPRLHFGVGESKVVDVEIFWPGGLREDLKNVPANQLITFREGVGIVQNRGWSRG